MKISENPYFMYRQNFKNFPKNVRIGAGMRRKNQNLFGLAIWPPKMPNLFGLANQASKNANFVRIGPKITIFAQLSVSTQTNYVIIRSPSIPSALVPRCARLPSAFLPCSYNRSYWFEQVSSVQDNKQMRNSENSSGRRVAPSHEFFWECLHHLYLTYRIKKRCTNDLESSRKSDIQWQAGKLHSY